MTRRWRRRGGAADARGAVLEASRRWRDLRWVRRLGSDELERLVLRIDADLAEHSGRDDLLELAARLHYDREARRRRGARSHPDDARSAAVAVVFEERFGVALPDALRRGMEVEPADERVVRLLEALRRMGVSTKPLQQAHWLATVGGQAVHLRLYADAGALDLYAPVRPFNDDEDAARLAELLRQNGGSIGGAFWGICTFEAAGDHLCACARLAADAIGDAALAYALESVLGLVHELER